MTTTAPPAGKPPVNPEKVHAAQTAVGHELEAERQERIEVRDNPDGITASLIRLRAPFPADQIGKLPRSTCRDCSQSQRKRCDRHSWVTRCDVCNNSHSSATMHIDYVGHADVTARLLSVDPLWTWEPMGRDQFGGPALDRDGMLWINLTVCGITRPGVGEGKNAKERIGNAIRNAAMRFGVALDLWAKGDRDWAQAPKDEHEPESPVEPDEPSVPSTTGGVTLTTADVLEQLDALAAQAGVDRAQITAKFRAAHGGIDVSELPRVPLRELHGLVRQIEDYLAEQQKAAG